MTIGEQLSGMDIQQNPLIWHAQDQKGTELLNILVYQMEHILTYVITGNFLLLLLYRAVQQIRGVFYLDISFICWFRGHLGPRLFFWSFVVQEVDEGHKGSEDTTKFDVHTSGSLFQYVPEICLFHSSGFLLVKSKTSSLGTTLLTCQIITISEFFQMLDYKNFLVDGNASRSCPMTGFGNGWWHLKSTTRNSNIQPHPPHLSHVNSLIGSLSHVTQN